MANIFTKGSLWRKCDLHAHTPLDHEWINRPDLSTTEKKKSFAKEYIEFAQQEGLEIIGITDHNFCNQIEDLILPYIIDEAIANSITILPGFEITVKDGSGIHVLVLFKEDTTVNEIFDVVKRLFPLGTILTPSTGIIPVSENDLDGLKLILDGSKLDYLLIFAHADRENGVLDKSTIVGERRVQEWQKPYINICQLSKSKEDFPAGSFISTVINKTNTHYARDISYIVSSDCRSISKTNLEEGRQFLGQKFTWIKGDATFEGLKQIVFEPNTRVKVQDDKPEQKRPHLFIDKVRFVSPSTDLTFSNEFIEINPNLNSIIGGKSSGKSLLLYYIAKTIDPLQLEVKYNDLDVSDRYPFETAITGFDFEVIWGDGTSFKLTDPQESKNRQITYIPQMYINHLAEKRGNDELKKLIQSILEEKPDFLEFFTASKDEISRLKVSIANNIYQYFEQEKKLIANQNQIKSKGDKAARQQNLEKRIEELAALRIEAGFNEEEEKDYIKQLNNRTLHDSRRKNLETLKDVILNDYSIEMQRIEEEVKRSIKKLTDNTASKFVGAEKIQKAYIDKINLYEKDLLASFENIYVDLVSKAEKIDRCIQKSTDKIAIYDLALTPYLNKITKKEKLEEIQNDITQEESTLTQIKELEQQESVLVKQMSNYKKEVLLDYEKMLKRYQTVIKEINTNYSDINPEKQINLKAILSFDTQRFFNNCTRNINKQTALAAFGNYFNYNNFVFTESSHLTDLTDFFEKILSEDIRYNQGGNQSVVCTSMFDDYFIIDFEIYEKDESIFRMSPGKKGLILLYLILHLSNASYPILIDQPEDNLDNRTVYKELKDFMKTKKIERQVIIVTHNANLVVPTDSENIIVANQSGQDKGKENETYQFEYVSGSLENSFVDDSVLGILNQMGIREHVCEILEGGEDAFKEREIRYSIN